MSMISEQISFLRDLETDPEIDMFGIRELQKAFKDAADTIEELSTKLANANMERSTAYYNDGWIPVEDGLPKEKGYYLCQCRGFFRICGFAKNLEKVDKYDFAGEKHAGFYDFDAEFGYCEVHGIIAWRELPPEYKPKKEEKNCDNCANKTDWDEVDRGCYMCCKGLENNYEPKGE